MLELDSLTKATNHQSEEIKALHKQNKTKTEGQHKPSEDRLIKANNQETGR